MTKPIVITLGEPAGIGPDILIKLVQHELPVAVVAIADPEHLQQRAAQLNLPLTLLPWDQQQNLTHTPGTLPIIAISCQRPVVPGQLDVANANYVLSSLTMAAQLCLSQQAAAVMTGPVNKAVINQAGIPFTGQTEFFAQRCQAEKVVMMLASQQLRVALVTTHLPLAQVPQAVTAESIYETVRVVNDSLQQFFAITAPRLRICGLNPHAGESGYLGREEIELINPTLASLRSVGVDVTDCMPADTLFTKQQLSQCDAVIAMYHDQGLPVIKSVGFGQTINISLGLPIIRTSVDHGTALELAGTGKAEADSLIACYELTQQMINNQVNYAA